jgi:dGTPase
MMNWEKLISTKRLGKGAADVLNSARSPFQQDYDRIIFSSAFRRLQDKTQVFPLAESDYVRTRLTHSLEAACIGRTLGTMVGQKICDKYSLAGITSSDFGSIVAAACLTHDIGNPPFGHSGEEAISNWFQNSPMVDEVKKQLPKDYVTDFEKYEGNAQGFRLVTRLLFPDNVGGMQLTSTTLAAFAKYPIQSFKEELGDLGDAGSIKKFSFFRSERDLFALVAEETGLIRKSKTAYWWARHPLAFLVEAADDICYRVIDFEDGFRVGQVNYDEVEERFKSLITKHDKITSRLSSIKGQRQKVEYLRSIAIGELMEEVTEHFMKQEEKMLKGEFDKALIEGIPHGTALEKIRLRSKEIVYSARTVVEVEAAGFEVLGGLLDIIVPAAIDSAKNGKKASSRSRKFLQLIPEQYLGFQFDNEYGYPLLLSIIDFVCGMTDSYAVATYKKIKGISLPSN